jgi:hypothetical protein
MEDLEAPHMPATGGSRALAPPTQQPRATSGSSAPGLPLDACRSGGAEGSIAKLSSQKSIFDCYKCYEAQYTLVQHLLKLAKTRNYID